MPKNQAQILHEINDQFAKAFSILGELQDRGYFDPHGNDSEEEADLKEAARGWIEEFEKGGD